MGGARVQTLDGPVSETTLRRRLQSEGYEVTRYVYAPGTRFPDHTHEVDKIDAVVSGRFQIVIEGDAFMLGSGDFVHVPRGVRHSAEVIGDEPVVSLDGVRRVRSG
jgi:quercetin dioxygenase-like cupin family protein